MKIRKLLVIGSTVLFLSSLVTTTASCGGSKKTSSAKGPKVKSGSGMGNTKHKNKHVWGK